MLFNKGSNEMSEHLDKVSGLGISKGMTEPEAALFAVTKFLEFLSHPDNLEKAFNECPEVTGIGTVNLIRRVSEWLFVKNSVWNLPDTLEELVP